MLDIAKNTEIVTTGRDYWDTFLKVGDWTVSVIIFVMFVFIAGIAVGEFGKFLIQSASG